MERRKKGIKTIDWGRLLAVGPAVVYCDDNFIVINRLDRYPFGNDSVRADCIFMVSCFQGAVTFEMNAETYRLEHNNVLVVLPNSVIGHVCFDADCTLQLVGVSTAYLQQLIRMDRRTWNLVSYYYQHPVLCMTDYKNLLLQSYKQLLQLRIEGEQHVYYRDVVRHLLSAFACEIVAELGKEVPAGAVGDGASDRYSSGEQIYRQFFDMVMADGGMHRNVAYYADRLCYTPKYLSKVVKEISGRTPLDIINEHAIEHIKRALKYSDKSIKEISEEFNFSNHSFFGKYVKAALGIPPHKYRVKEKE